MQTTKTPHQYSTWNTTPVGLLLLKHPKLHSKLQKRYLLTDDPAKSASAKFHISKVSQSRDGSKKFKEVVPIFLRHLNCIHWQPTLGTHKKIQPLDLTQAGSLLPATKDHRSEVDTKLQDETTFEFFRGEGSRIAAENIA
jgi:hypothetical protein